MTDPLNPAVVETILQHMNTDHAQDNVVIVRAHGVPDATSAVMAAYSLTAGYWTATSPRGTQDIRIGWSSPLTDRASVRRRIVDLYTAARKKAS